MPKVSGGEDKATLRRQIRAARRARDASTRAQLEVGLCEQLMQVIPQHARKIAAFVPVRGELGVRPWAAEVLPEHTMTGAARMMRPQTSWCFPRSVGETLEFCTVMSPDSWTLGRFRIPEPTTAVMDPDEIEWLIIPALGCDRQGVRLGQGAGFYDRFLAAHPRLQATTVALVDEAGVFERLPRDSWDIPVTFVVSPGETWRINTSA